MRRLLAAAALAWINFTLIFAAAGTLFNGNGAASNLPRCCRRDGKHACSLMTQPPGFGPAFQNARCPLYPGGRAVPAQAKATGATRIAVLRAAVVRYSARQPQSEILCRMSYSRASQKRGPPLSWA
jgi:hypothetical protein